MSLHRRHELQAIGWSVFGVARDSWYPSKLILKEGEIATNYIIACE